MQSQVLLMNSTYEILEYENGDCYIKELALEKYFFKEKFFASEKIHFDNEERITWGYKDNILLGLIIFSIPAMIYLLVNSNDIFSYVSYGIKDYIISILFLLLNLTLHECGHVLTLKIFGRKVGEIKFKLNFIFPAISVNTTDSYMMPRYRRAFVYYAGVMINAYICLLFMIMFPAYIHIIRPVVWAIAVNLLPMGYLKSDGYHLFINTLFNVKDLKNKPNTIYKLTKWFFVSLIVGSLIISVGKSIGIIM